MTATKAKDLMRHDIVQFVNGKQYKIVYHYADPDRVTITYVKLHDQTVKVTEYVDPEYEFDRVDNE